MRKLGLLLRDVWRLARGYWVSEEWRSAWLFLVAVIGLSLLLVYVTVLVNHAYGDMYNSLQKKDAALFFSTFGMIMALIMLYLAVAVLRFYLNLTLQLRWRRWLTDRYLQRWLTNRAFYRMRFTGRVDNPDQRISEDVRQFISQTMSLGLGLLSSVVTLFSFAGILWGLSGSLTIPVFGTELVIPGYMFWAAVLYSGIGSVLAHLVGRPLIFLQNRQQGVEADFRFGLVRLREEAEGIALYGGEAQERQGAFARFLAVYANYRRIILRSTIYNAYNIFIGQLASFFPFLVGAPRYFSGAIELGALMQTVNAFGRVNDSLSWFIDIYQTFADWRATVDRLTEFGHELVDEGRLGPEGAEIERDPGVVVELDQVAVALPNGEPLLEPVTLRLDRGKDVLITGPTGSGKSTLFRVLAGIWPFSRGHVHLPKGAKSLFLPQRPYMPIASLREALWFPAAPPPDSDDAVLEALAKVDLSRLGDRLDEIGHWAQMLSPGEQQRLALARALLLKPDWLFLDEATSAMDETQEAQLYHTLAESLPKTTVISIGHREALRTLHDRTVLLERVEGHPGRLVEAAAVA